MKVILHNPDNLNESEITRKVYRAKALIINFKDEILLGYGDNNYQLPGGHLEENETFDECLVREIKEETGIIIQEEKRKPFIVIKYMSKDYPNKGDKSYYEANYYYINSNLEPDLTNIDLTENEKEGMFELRYIHKDKVLEELYKSLNTCKREGVVMDTIEVIKEFLKVGEL